MIYPVLVELPTDGVAVRTVCRVLWVSASRVLRTARPAAVGVVSRR
jgi:hypothetical protein